jgi:hypothetical protein
MTHCGCIIAMLEKITIFAQKYTAMRTITLEYDDKDPRAEALIEYIRVLPFINVKGEGDVSPDEEEKAE